MTLLRAATYNVYAKSPAKAVAEDLEKILDLVEVIGFQEFGMAIDVKQLQAAADKHGFTVIRSVNFSTPIAFRNEVFELIDFGSEFLSEETFVGKEGAGPATLANKRAQWVALCHKPTGRKFVFVNCHLAPSIYLEVRKELHDEQTDNLSVILKDLKMLGNVVVLGDFNVNAADAKLDDPDLPFVKFANINIKPNWEVLGLPSGVGTHGRQFIDYVWFVDRPLRFRAVAQNILKGYGSDHKPLIVTFDVSETLALKARRAKNKLIAARRAARRRARRLRNRRR